MAKVNSVEKRYRLQSVVVLVTSIFCMNLVSAEILGARGVLDKIVGNDIKGQAEELSPRADLLEKLQSYRNDVKKLSKQERARKWSSLAVASTALSEGDSLEQYQNVDPVLGAAVSLRGVVASLPEPDTWSSIGETVSRNLDSDNSTSAEVLRFILASLSGDRTAQYKSLDALDKTEGLLAENPNIPQQLSGLRYQLALNDHDIDRLFAALSSQLNTESEYGESIEVPDLVTLVGKTKAEQWLREALVKSKSSINISVGEETRKLAKRLATELSGQLMVPHWGLVHDLDSIELYEALEARFEKIDVVRERYHWDLRQAKVYYLLSLIAAGHAEKASSFASRLIGDDGVSLSKDTLYELEKNGYALEVESYLKGLLKQKPGLPLWDVYIRLSSHTGHSEDALALIESLQSENPDLLAALRDNYIDMLLATDNVDKAVSLIQERLTSSTAEEQSSMGLKLATLGLLLGDDDLVEQGLSASRSAIDAVAADLENYWRGEAVRSHVQMLRKMQRYAESEQLLARELTKTIKQLQEYEKLTGYSAALLVGANAQPYLVELAGVYRDLKRWEDVKILLDEFPYWGAADLAELYQSEDSYEIPLGVYVSEALIGLDDIDAAIPILEALIENENGYDRSYELYTDMKGENAIGFLEGVYKNDPFEERPLIWKGIVLFNQGRLLEAEEVIRQAIAIDPSDGEQGPGDRMRAYSVLADILESSDPDATALYRRAVDTIRQSERADEFADAGLHSRSIDLYDKAASHFSDAYCVQSRLAIQLTKQGRFEQATRHYRMAYELMPDSFGRVESHCFGCENVFNDPRAQTIAEEVFQQLVEKNPGKAQVHYMLGYLRKEQGRYTEAIEMFRRAVGIDDLYLNAWKQLFEVGRKIHMEAWERDTIALKLLELDPKRKHIGLDLESVSDFSGLWLHAEQAINLTSKKIENLYPLAASQQSQTESASENNAQQQLFERAMGSFSGQDNQWQLPGQALLATGIIDSALNMLETDRYDY